MNYECKVWCIKLKHTLKTVWNVYEAKHLLVVQRVLYFLVSSLPEVMYAKLLMEEEKPLLIYGQREKHFGVIIEWKLLV